MRIILLILVLMFTPCCTEVTIEAEALAITSHGEISPEQVVHLVS
jgi:hypothetical protein